MTESEDKKPKGGKKAGKKAAKPPKPGESKGPPAAASPRRSSRKAKAAEPVAPADPVTESEPPSSGLFPPVQTEEPIISNVPEDLEMTVNLSGDLFRLPGRDDLEGPTQTFMPDEMHRALDRIRAARENGASAHAGADEEADADGGHGEPSDHGAPLHDDSGVDADVDDSAETVALPGRDVARNHLKGLVEAIVFVADAPMKAGEIARAASAPVKEVRPLLEELRAEYSLRGIHLDEIAGGWLFRTAAVYAPFVRDVTGKKPVRLSRAQVETLAIVAYRQPITRPEVDEIRGVDCGPVLKLLLERDLVRILGKKDEPGRPILYGTTAEFLELFGLKSLKDLPTLKEFTDLSDDSRRVYEDETGEGVEDAFLRRQAEAEAAEAAAAAEAPVAEAPPAAEAPAAAEAPPTEDDDDEGDVRPAPGGEESTDEDEFPEDYDDDDFEDDEDDDEDDEGNDDDDEGNDDEA